MRSHLRVFIRKVTWLKLCFRGQSAKRIGYERLKVGEVLVHHGSCAGGRWCCCPLKRCCRGCHRAQRAGGRGLHFTLVCLWPYQQRRVFWGVGIEKRLKTFCDPGTHYSLLNLYQIFRTESTDTELGLSLGRIKWMRPLREDTYKEIYI